MNTPPDEREVADLATLKALADPLRLAILGFLMDRAGVPVTVKEIAGALEEPPTKLYRHIRQLERAGLAVVAGTRLVSGIVESRYVAAQRTLRLSREVFAGGTAGPADGVEVLLAAVDVLGRDLRRHFGAGRLDLAGGPDGPGGAPALAHLTVRMAPGRLAAFRERMLAVAEEFGREEEPPGTETPEAAEAAEAAETPEAVEVTLFSLLYGLGPARTS